ncbi:MAG: rRNA maturation RNase YbeY [Pararhodobacter sp.]
MPIEVNAEDPRWGDLPLDIEALATRAANAALGHLGHAPAEFEISLLACSDARIRGLNAQFRAQDKPTNVLSWPASDLAAEKAGTLPCPPDPGSPDDPEPLGDIALALETCLREATQAHRPLADHVTHLLVHSVLHLLGYDHENDDDALLMERTETAILETLGIPDPYAGGSGAPDQPGEILVPPLGKDR